MLRLKGAPLLGQVAALLGRFHLDQPLILLVVGLRLKDRLDREIEVFARPLRCESIGAHSTHELTYCHVAPLDVKLSAPGVRPTHEVAPTGRLLLSQPLLEPRDPAEDVLKLFLK